MGAGVIGCEYASMFAALGIDVTLLGGRERVLPFLDFEIGDRLRRPFPPHPGWPCGEYPYRGRCWVWG